MCVANWSLDTMPFIDHFSIGVSDLARSGSFYDALLATIGAARRFEKPDFICYGTSSGEFFVVNVPDDKTSPIAHQPNRHPQHPPEIPREVSSVIGAGVTF